jgi:MOSC domain-containing protein YiiM
LIQLLSVQAGLPQTLIDTNFNGGEPTEWTTAFKKEPVCGAVWVARDNVSGDRQASTMTHGGPDKAVCAYPFEHYSYWKERLNLGELSHGAFGENFTLRGQLEEECCIGDIVGFGDIALQVSQPRPPCWRLARRWQQKDFAVLMEENARTGWYFRVIEEGYVEAGTPMCLLERPHPQWTVAIAHRLVYQPRPNVDQIEELASCNALSVSWRETLHKRLTGNKRS